MLLNVDAVTSSYNLKGLRHLYDVVESQVRGLRSLGVPAELYGSLLSSVLLNKLPQELRLVISRQTSEEEWNLDNLMEIIEREIAARERAASSSSSYQVPRRTPREPPTATTLIYSSSIIPRCSYCRQSHTSNSCKAVIDIAERKQILKRSGRCFVCLRKNHLSRDCRSTMKCARCSGYVRRAKQETQSQLLVIQGVMVMKANDQHHPRNLQMEHRRMHPSRCQQRCVVLK